MKLKSIFNKRVASILGMGAMVGLFALDANAATALDGMGAQWKTQVNAGLGIAKMIFGLIGFFFVAAGLFFFYKDSKEPGRGELKKGITACLVGSGLMIIPWFIGLFTETIAPGEGGTAVDQSRGTTF
jgi:hypothetical protein